MKQFIHIVRVIIFCFGAIYFAIGISTKDDHLALNGVGIMVISMAFGVLKDE